MDRHILLVKNLETAFCTSLGVVKAVNGVSFSLGKGETLGLVGESGSGKSMTGLSILRLVPPPGRIIGGEVMFDGEDLLRKTQAEMRSIRGSRISMILQDPMTSMNPVLTVGFQVIEPIRIHQKVRGKEAFEKAKELLNSLRIPSAGVRMRQYAHQMSGGMRQRIVAAMALSCQPELLIADEPTTSLDVTVQARFLDILKEIRQTAGAAMILITHDFGIVADICQKVAVMYAGRIVESGTTKQVFDSPAHPYTIALMNSRPRMGVRTPRLYTIGGQPPELWRLPQGCSFAPRCGYAIDVCNQHYPLESEVETRHVVKCWLSKDRK